MEPPDDDLVVFLNFFGWCLRGKNKRAVCLFMGTDPGLSPCRKIYVSQSNN